MFYVFRHPWKIAPWIVSIGGKPNFLLKTRTILRIYIYIYIERERAKEIHLQIHDSVRCNACVPRVIRGLRLQLLRRMITAPAPDLDTMGSLVAKIVIHQYEYIDHHSLARVPRVLLNNNKCPICGSMQ